MPEISYQVRIKPLSVQGCYAPGTPDEYLQRTARQAVEQLIRTSLHAYTPGRNADIGFILENDTDRWGSTATDGSGLGQGDPTTLTWSIVPDGTFIPSAFPGDISSNSILQAELNLIYGNQAAWLPLFSQVFQRWSELTGINYVYEPNDDGATFPSSRGLLGVRGDIRISGHPIDGNSGILAYNYYPNWGDMVIDVPDAFYNNTSNNSLGLRNMLAHEHGHGLGLSHTCPVDQTKLMEPFISFSFDGPQHDDILDANRAYGDPAEDNDQTVLSTGLGAAVQLTLDSLSVDDDADTDYFSLQLGASSELSVALTPLGSTYPRAEQQSDGSCPGGIPYDSLTRQDLRLDLLDTDGTSVLRTADDVAAGFAEEISNHVVNYGAGTYYLRITGSSLDIAQLYQLDISVEPLDACGGDVVALAGLSVNNGETYTCTADTALTLENITVYAGGTLEVSAPLIEMRANVTVEDDAVLNVNP